MTGCFCNLQVRLPSNQVITTTSQWEWSGLEPLAENLLKVWNCFVWLMTRPSLLFDNCFEIVSGPDAPDVTIQELENELILYLTNDNPLSNNYEEEYSANDPSIPDASLKMELVLTEQQRSYLFRGLLGLSIAGQRGKPF